MLSIHGISWQPQAHQPDPSSTMLTEQETKRLLQVSIEGHFGESSHGTSKEFQELVVNYVRDNISILLNDANATILRNGMIKLGHETKVILQLAGAPEIVQSLTVETAQLTNHHF